MNLFRSEPYSSHSARRLHLRRPLRSAGITAAVPVPAANAPQPRAAWSGRWAPAAAVLRSVWLPALAAVLGLASLSPAVADSGRSMPQPVLKVYVQECASCHLAFPPGMLPAASWQRLMVGLDRHYGTDASIDAASAQQIQQWLQQHAGTYKRVSEAPPQDRITRSAWFERKHRKVAPAVWQLPSVKSAANCSACHGGADQGDFDDDRLRMPAGLTARQRLAWHD